VRQNEIVVNLKQHQLMLQAFFALANRIDPSSNGGNALTDIEIEPLDHGRIDLPATRCQDLDHGLHSAKHHSVFHPHHTFVPVLFDDLCV
jgi:hypothetical protein